MTRNQTCKSDENHTCKKEAMTHSTSNTDSSKDKPLLRVEGLKKHFSTGSGMLDRLFGGNEKIKAVDGVDFDIYPREIVGLVGESGCGKSTVGRSILSLNELTAGSVDFRGNDLSELAGKELKAQRRDLQMVFQDPRSSLNPRKTVSQIISTPMEIQGMYEDEREKRVNQLLNDVGLSERYANSHIHQLSGGQLQRISIARALSIDPELIICDEPVSALDVSVQVQILDLLQDIQEEYDLSLLFISHDLSVVRYITDKVLVMYVGRIIERAPTNELFTNPSHPYTAGLLNAIPHPDPRKSGQRQGLEGDVPSSIDPPSGCPFHPRCPKYIGDICESEDPKSYQIGESHTAACHLHNEEIS